MAYFQAMSFHEGEEKMHDLTRVAVRDNPMSPGLTPRAAQQISMYPLMALGTTDPNDDNRPWTTIWGGEAPMAQQVARGGIIGIKATLDATYDPVVKALLGSSHEGEVIKQSQDGGAMVSGLSIDLVQRNRVKLFGRMVAGALSPNESSSVEASSADGQKGKSGSVQLVLKIEQSLGNCPKYLNKKIVTPHTDLKPQLISDNIILPRQAIDLIHRTDLFFISSSHKFEDMDTNYRGGPPGFLRTLQPDADSSSSTGTVLIWPEYSGNNLYQTLGNLITTPRAGIAIPDFENGSILYLSGETEVLVNNDADQILAKSKLAVRFTTTRARFVQDGLGFRGRPTEDSSLGRSPYNPRVRFLRTEKTTEFSQDYNNPASNDVTAKLIGKTKLSPTITKYRFSLSDPSTYGPWKPGQYVALDFSSELDMGYSHMRDDDPTSLNDDYIRTFTVSSPPGSLGIHGEEFEIVVRTAGSVTRWMTGQREGMTEAGVKGFGGEFAFENKSLDESQRVSRSGVFIAAGVGITPLLGQRGTDKKLKTRWSVSIRDIGLVAEVLRELSEEVKKDLTIYLTGKDEDLNDSDRALLKEVSNSGICLERRRMEKADLTELEADIDDWYLCTQPAMRKIVQEWLPGKTIVFENFDY